MLRPPSGRGQTVPVKVRRMWKHLCRAAVESSLPGRNWRWMLASLGVGAGFGLVAGLKRLGAKPATFSWAVAGTLLKVALVALAVAWIATVAIRVVRSIRRRD